MNNKKISILGLCFLCFFILFSCNKEANGKMQGSEQEIVLREEGGDFGYPNPFRHQNRGPGFFKMELIYDSLLEKDEKGLTLFRTTPARARRPYVKRQVSDGFRNG